MSYSKAINVQESRNGSLFQKTFRRKLVDADGYFERVVYYIHRQLEHHKFREGNYHSYRWSSYGNILREDRPDPVHRELLRRFGGRDAFIKFHETGFWNKIPKEVEIEEE